MTTCRAKRERVIIHDPIARPASAQGADAHVWLSTGPEHPATHWYQCRLLLREPLAVNATQTVSGVLRFKANKRLSYDITFDAFLDGTHITSKNTIQLHNQMYHCEHATPSPSKRSPRSRDASRPSRANTDLNNWSSTAAGAAAQDGTGDAQVHADGNVA